MKHINNIFVILAAFVLCVACSSDDPKPPVSSIETINLSSNSSEITLGETVEFTVIANTKEDLTNKAIYFVNNNEININTFEPQEVGNYEIFAKYGDIKSNIVNLKVKEAPIESITIMATKKEMFVGDVASLLVFSDTEKDITYEATIFVNDELYRGFKFTTENAGVYEIYAIFNDTLQSEKIIITVKEVPVASVTLTIHNDEIKSGDTVSYTVRSDTDKDLTEEAKLFVNGSLLEDDNFIPTEAGEYTIYVLYEGIKSNEITFVINESKPAIFVKHPLVESFTHTKCPYCPRLFYAIEKIEEQTDQVIHISYHPFQYLGGNTSRPDFLFNSEPSLLWTVFKNKYNTYTVPNAEINRSNMWNKPQPEKLKEVTDLINEDGTLGLALDLVSENDVLNINVKTKFAKEYENKIRLTVHILENNLIHDYPNVTTYFEGQNPVENYAINHVFRHCLTYIRGDEIPQNDIKVNNIYVRDFSVNIPDNIQDQSQISVVAFITDNTTKEILNARIINLGDEPQSFEDK